MLREHTQSSLTYQEAAAVQQAPSWRWRQLTTGALIRYTQQPSVPRAFYRLQRVQLQQCVLQIYAPSLLRDLTLSTTTARATLSMHLRHSEEFTAASGASASPTSASISTIARGRSAHHNPFETAG